ncbi:MAG: phosphoglycerate dehydrogenase [Candidatus Latescibacteria bacterium]|jgi:D-3-phosphoglycerate dehydrogenase / 2-oxoglutarate reductase|nr:phosphoglycerate dehydrogenase [Candidatus Latescibacterota bacterium]
MYRVIVLDKLADEGIELLEAAEGIAFDVRTGLSGEELREALCEYDGAICRSGVKITAASLEGNTRLKAIVRAGVGTDNIDGVAATRQGIIVMNTPTGNTLSTAEHAFTLMMALSRNVAPAHESLRGGRWDRSSFTGVQLAGKTLGIVGLGRIGQEVASRALAFQMKVIGYDPFVSGDQASKMGIDYVDNVPAMLPSVDYLTVHTPLIPATRHLISHNEIELLKPGARLINCARGGIYDEAALVAGLESGKLGGVALDVFETEPCTESPLFDMPGALCTPHLGASTREAQTGVAVEATELLVNFLATGEVRHAVNAASMDPKVLRAMRGYLDVAYRLGVLLAQWHSGGASACRLNYRGKVTEENTRLLTAAFCAGLLENALEEDVNIVNAEILLRERNIDLSENSRSDPGPFSSSITAELDCNGTTFIAGGTLFGNDMPRLIRLMEYRLESYLDGNLLIFTHEDVPGIIGSVGTIFGEHKVNIAQMSVGRAGTAPGGAAIGVLNMDGVPPEKAVDQVLRMQTVSSVRFIELPHLGNLPPWLRV